MITASMLYSFSTCPHRVTLDLFGDPAERDEISPFVELLWERGSAFEKETIEKLGVPFLNLRDVPRIEREGMTMRAILSGEDLIYGGRISHAGLLGEPDLLRRTDHGYIPGDIKSGAGLEGQSEDADGKPKKHYALQLSLYSDILQGKGWAESQAAFVWDIHGQEVAYDLSQARGPRTPQTMWEEYEDALETVTAIANQAIETTPALIGDCKLCHWRSHCRRQINISDDLTLISELGRSRRDKFPPELRTVRGLANTDLDSLIRGSKTTIEGIGAKTLRTWHARAVLQKQENAKPYFIEPVELPTATVELFFDVETDPFRDLCYLHGFVRRVGGRNSTEQFIPFTADEATPELEKDAFADAWRFVHEHADAIVYYYSPYERTTWKRLARQYPDVASEDEVMALFEQPRFIDLYQDFVRSKMIWPTSSLSIKALAKFLGFQWRDTDPSGAASVQWFHHWVETGDPAIWARILAYNEDDCRAMRVLADALRKLNVA
ncbi:TM0106 family RecB-like putative nuclease [Candidatus Bipolaricaulota bacterium]|nr:TM0106 family RecB-like putative nuclease [Candidatus Bipolaricaulota bacterium]